MAADSAVTVTNGDRTKIYNTATKIFRMSLDNPVGIINFRADAGCLNENPEQADHCKHNCNRHENRCHPRTYSC